GAEDAAGRPDRDDRPAEALSGRRHQRRGAASCRDAGIQEDRRHQHRSEGAPVRNRGLRDRRRSVRGRPRDDRSVEGPQGRRVRCPDGGSGSSSLRFTRRNVTPNTAWKWAITDAFTSSRSMACPRTFSMEVMIPPSWPHGRILRNSRRSVVTLWAKPWNVTFRWTASPASAERRDRIVLDEDQAVRDLVLRPTVDERLLELPHPAVRLAAEVQEPRVPDDEDRR